MRRLFLLYTSIIIVFPVPILGICVWLLLDQEDDPVLAIFVATFGWLTVTWITYEYLVNGCFFCLPME